MNMTCITNDKSSRHIIESFFRRIPLPYPITSFIISISIYTIYIFFGEAIGRTTHPSDHLVGISLGALVGYQMAAISYLSCEMRRIISSLDDLGISNESQYYIIGNKLLKSPWRYVLMICIVLPFYLIDWGSYSLYEYFFYFHNEFKLRLAIPYDIFMDVLDFITLLLLSIIIWIICVLTYLLQYAVSVDGAEGDSHKTDSQSMKIKMESIRSLLSKIIIIIIVSISLAIFSYVNPDKFYSTEILMLLAILFFNMILFTYGNVATRCILKNRVTYELNRLNQKSREQINKLLIISPIDDGNEDIKFSSISEMLDVLKKEREQLEDLYPRGFDLRSLVSLAVASIGPFLIPIATGMLKMILKENRHVITQLNSTAIEYAYNMTIQLMQVKP